MMLLIVLTGDDTDEPMESRLLLARDEEDERRNEVRRVEGVRRAAMAWKREDCILGGCGEVIGAQGTQRDVWALGSGGE